MQGYHHIVTDGVSGTLIARRVAAHYSALVAGGTVPPSDAAPWREIVAEEEAYLGSGAREADRAFWRDVLADAPEPVGFAGRPAGNGPAAPKSTVVRVRGEVPADDALLLREAARAYGTRWPAMVTAAAPAWARPCRGTTSVTPCGRRAARRRRSATSVIRSVSSPTGLGGLNAVCFPVFGCRS